MVGGWLGLWRERIRLSPQSLVTAEEDGAGEQPHWLHAFRLLSARPGQQEHGHLPHKRVIARTVERGEQPVTSVGVRFPHDFDERTERGAFVPFGYALGRLQRLDMHVQVADIAERTCHPAQLLAQREQLRREHRPERAHGGAQPSGRHAHLMQLFGILAESRPRLVREHVGHVPAQRDEAKFSRGRILISDDGAEVKREAGHQAGRTQTRLELRLRREPQAGRGTQRVDELADPRHGPGERLFYFDAADGFLLRSVVHRRFVQRQDGEGAAVLLDEERLAVCLDREERAQGARTQQQGQPVTHRPGGASRVVSTIGERLVHLQAAAGALAGDGE